MLITSLIGQKLAQDAAEQQQDNQDVLSNAMLYDYAITDPNVPLPLKIFAHKHGMGLAEEHGGKDIQDQLPQFGQMLGNLAAASSVKGLHNQLLAQARAQSDKPSPFAPADTASSGAADTSTLANLPRQTPAPVSKAQLAGMPPEADWTDRGWTTAPLPDRPLTRTQLQQLAQVQGQAASPTAIATPAVPPPTGALADILNQPPTALTPGVGATPASLTQGASPWIAQPGDSAKLGQVGGYIGPAGTGVPAPAAGTPAAAPHLSKWQRIARGIGTFGAGLQGHSFLADEIRGQQQVQQQPDAPQPGGGRRQQPGLRTCSFIERQDQRTIEAGSVIRAGRMAEMMIEARKARAAPQQRQ